MVLDLLPLIGTLLLPPWPLPMDPRRCPRPPVGPCGTGLPLPGARPAFPHLSLARRLPCRSPTARRAGQRVSGGGGGGLGFFFSGFAPPARKIRISEVSGSQGANLRFGMHISRPGRPAGPSPEAVDTPPVQIGRMMRKMRGWWGGVGLHFRMPRAADSPDFFVSRPHRVSGGGGALPPVRLGPSARAGALS